MTLERRRPLPAGRYWADIFPQNRDAWATWISTNKNAGTARVETTEHTDATAGAPEHDFVIFVTTEPLEWKDSLMGFAPDVAGQNVQSADDTVTKPEPSDGPGADPISRVLQGVYTVGAIAAGLIILAGVFSLSRVHR